MIKKLQKKFVAINMTMVTIMLCIIFVLVYHFTQQNMETESISMMKAIAANPYHAGHPNDASSSLKLPFFTLQLGKNGELVSTGGGYYDLSDLEVLDSLIKEASSSRNEIGVIKEHNLRYYRVKLPMGTVLVFSDMSSEKTTLKNLLQSFAIIGTLSFLIFLCISIFLAKWAVKPVAKAWLQQKQFVADASHELKTPLTVIMTNTELLQYPDSDEKDRHRILENITLMSLQMQRLIEKMLILARSENHDAALPMSHVCLSDIVSHSALSFEGVFAERGLTLESFTEPNIYVQGNEDALRQVIDILLDNAQKYASEHSTTRIALCRLPRKKCCLRVSNPGDEIPAEELASIFQRFYRADHARKRDGSFGLGLAIAESIIDRHHGKIWAESKDGINTFFVELHTSVRCRREIV